MTTVEAKSTNVTTITKRFLGTRILDNDPRNCLSSNVTTAKIKPLNVCVYSKSKIPENAINLLTNLNELPIFVCDRLTSDTFEKFRLVKS